LHHEALLDAELVVDQRDAVAAGLELDAGLRGLLAGVAAVDEDLARRLRHEAERPELLRRRLTAAAGLAAAILGRRGRRLAAPLARRPGHRPRCRVLGRPAVRPRDLGDQGGGPVLAAARRGALA